MVHSVCLCKKNANVGAACATGCFFGCLRARKNLSSSFLLKSMKLLEFLDFEPKKIVFGSEIFGPAAASRGDFGGIIPTQLCGVCCSLAHICLLAQTKMSWRSLLTLRDSESRFRAVQCYDDPTMAVVADLTCSEDQLSLKPGYAVEDCHARRLPSVQEAQWL